MDLRARDYNGRMNDSSAPSPLPNASELDRVVGRVTGAICTTLFDRFHPELNCMFLTPALTYKVKHRLAQISALSGLTEDRIDTVAKLLRSDAAAVLRLYELDQEKIVQIEPRIELEAKKALRDATRPVPPKS